MKMKRNKFMKTRNVMKSSSSSSPPPPPSSSSSSSVASQPQMDLNLPYNLPQLIFNVFPTLIFSNPLQRFGSIFSLDRSRSLTSCILSSNTFKGILSLGILLAWPNNSKLRDLRVIYYIISSTPLQFIELFISFYSLIISFIHFCKYHPKNFSFKYAQCQLICFRHSPCFRNLRPNKSLTQFNLCISVQ